MIKLKDNGLSGSGYRNKKGFQGFQQRQKMNVKYVT